MPDIDEKKTEGAVPEDAENEELSSKSPKISFLKVGLPVLLVQVVLAYFLAGNIIVPRLYGDPTNTATSGSEAEMNEERDAPDFGKMFTLEDVIVNPAESKGMQFVLINFGFEVKEDNDLKILGDRQVQIRDRLIKVLSARTLSELDGPDDKETLRHEIKVEIDSLLPANHLKNVYFSNYIIQ